MIQMLSAWKHSGFHVFCCNRFSPNDDTAMENLARYIIRTSFSQERMTYLPETSQVIYKAKAGKDKEQKVFDALEWLATMCSHIPIP
jgi:Putative transposase.